MTFISASFRPEMPCRAFAADCGEYSTMEAFLDGLAATLAFPDWCLFGSRWDSLCDALTDLRWLEAEQIVLTLTGFRTMQTRFDEADRADAEAFLQTLRFAADHCHEVQPEPRALKFIIN